MRLEVILENVARTGCKVLADIGTDHAFIPTEAIKRKLAKKAIACDISPGPLGIAKKNIIKEDLAEYIELRLGDGLKPIRHGEACAIVIAGMGGMRILNIIEESFEKVGKTSLILQPQHDASKLRRGLFDLGIDIYGEYLAKEGERFYEILCASKSSEMNRKDKCGREAKSSETSCLLEEDFFVGSYTGELAPQFYLQKKQKIERYIHRISDENEKKQACKELAWLDNRLLRFG